MFNRHITILGLWTAMSLLPLPVLAQDQAADEPITELVVTGHRRAQPVLQHAGNIDVLDTATIERIGHQHPEELFVRASGVWVNRAPGQEHLTAIRAPVLTGPGSCGAFLFLEDSIPIRPSGFCNVNGLFEAGTEMAQSVEVIRGPGNALYGSNALHGIINVLMPEPGDGRQPLLALEGGANDFYRVRMDVPFDTSASWLASGVYAHDGGFRDDPYRQSKLHVKRAWDVTDGRFVLAASVTDLDQDTAGYVVGEDAYKDPNLNRINPNPEAFRKASSERVYGIWTRSLQQFELDMRPYVRHNDMEFLQHFLPGQPLEENSHVSAGLMTSATWDTETRSIVAGVDLEWSDLFLKETQDGPTEGSAFLVETRPEGKHYDYRVVSSGIAPYVQADWELGDRITLGAGLRAELVRYDYDNRMLDGNTRDDGTECGFGGCLYTRPADRSDNFTNIAPKLSLRYELSESTGLYANLLRGFRAPQATELYRLQSGQQVADLNSERLDSVEIGLRTQNSRRSIDVAAFAARKRDSIYRDAEGFNVSGARSKHLGIEGSFDLAFDEAWSLGVNASYAHHTYDFDTVASRGETFVSGRDVDTAPRILASAELVYAPASRFDASLLLTTIGKYYLDAENTATYPGHTIANLRVGFGLSDRLRLLLRINNVLDRDIADRADLAQGEYRYFPGRGRELFAELRYTPNESL